MSIGPQRGFEPRRWASGEPQMVIEFPAHERPRRLALSTRMSGVDINGTLTFHPVLEGTRMHWSWEMEPHGALKLMTPLLACLGRRQEATIWAGLKRLLEKQEASV